MLVINILQKLYIELLLLFASIYAINVNVMLINFPNGPGTQAFAAIYFVCMYSEKLK